MLYYTVKHRFPSVGILFALPCVPVSVSLLRRKVTWTMGVDNEAIREEGV